MALNYAPPAFLQSSTNGWGGGNNPPNFLAYTMTPYISSAAADAAENPIDLVKFKSTSTKTWQMSKCVLDVIKSNSGKKQLFFAFLRVSSRCPKRYFRKGSAQIFLARSSQNTLHCALRITHMHTESSYALISQNNIFHIVTANFSFFRFNPRIFQHRFIKQRTPLGASLHTGLQSMNSATTATVRKRSILGVLKLKE